MLNHEGERLRNKNWDDPEFILELKKNIEKERVELDKLLHIDYLFAYTRKGKNKQLRMHKLISRKLIRMFSSVPKSFIVFSEKF
jgi:hypothetical protein